MKKFILIGIIIIIGLIIFIGYYPPFFPFLRYGLFSKPATRIVFEIENFSLPPENFSLFLQEIENQVRQYWSKDARLAMVTAFFVPETDKEILAYGLEFFSDSCPNKSDNLPCQLNVFYNSSLFIEKDFIKSKFFNFKYHQAKVANNNQLSAVECIDYFLCQFMVANIKGEIKAAETKISGKQAFKIASTKKPELLEKTYIYEGEPAWFGLLRSEGNIPFWTIGPGPTIRVDARTGDILR